MRVRRFSEEAGSTALVRVNLRKALARLPNVPQDSAALCCVQRWHGTDLLWLGAWRGPAVQRTPASADRGTLPGWFPPGPPAEPPPLSRITGGSWPGSANLVANGSFESGSDGPDQWGKPPDGGPHRVTAGFSTDARFGKRSLELTVLENATGDWLGWDSREIPVRPGATYLLSGWLKGMKLQGWAAIHAHFHDARGALTRSGAMVSTQPP